MTFDTPDEIKPCRCWPAALLQNPLLPDTRLLDPHAGVERNYDLPLPNFGKYVFYLCPSCRGKALEPCHVCLGTGFEGQCPRCKGVKTQPCGYCLGKKRLQYLYPHFGPAHSWAPRPEVEVSSGK